MVVVVPDASVILKWVLPTHDEPYAENARALLRHYTEGKVELMVPTLWRFEIANTLTRRYPKDAFNDLLDLQSMAMFEPSLSREWLAQVCALVRESAVAFYDAAYHALAIVESATLVTADERYLRALDGSKCVCHLAEWRL